MGGVISHGDDGPFVVRIDEPPAGPPPPIVPADQRSRARRIIHALRRAVGQQLQFAPEFGPRGAVMRWGTPRLRGEWWATPRFKVVAEAYKHNFTHGRIRDGRSQVRLDASDPRFSHSSRFSRAKSTAHRHAPRATQLCMYYKGERVVDAFGDTLGEDDAYSSGSLQAVFSCSKMVAVIVFGWLRDRGYIDYDAKVSKYWPEFGCHGKENVTVQDLLKHDAGIPWLDEKVPDELTVGVERLDELAALLASQRRLFPPGQRVYHAVIQGPLLNELCRRADPHKRTVADVLRYEIARPLGIDVYLSATEAEAERLVTSYTPSELWATWNLVAPYAATKCFLGSDQAESDLDKTLAIQRDPNSLYNKASRPIATDEGSSAEERRRKFINTPALCASNGMANARGLAKLGAMIVNGGEVEGVRILKRATVREMCSKLDVRNDAFFGDSEMGWTRGGFCASRAAFLPLSLARKCARGVRKCWTLPPPPPKKKRGVGEMSSSVRASSGATRSELTLGWAAFFAPLCPSSFCGVRQTVGITRQRSTLSAQAQSDGRAWAARA